MHQRVVFCGLPIPYPCPLLGYASILPSSLITRGIASSVSVTSMDSQKTCFFHEGTKHSLTSRNTGSIKYPLSILPSDSEAQRDLSSFQKSNTWCLCTELLVRREVNYHKVLRLFYTNFVKKSVWSLSISPRLQVAIKK